MINWYNLWVVSLLHQLLIQIYEYILRCLRDVSWTYGKVACATYPLEQIDTINKFGDINPRSAMFCIIYGVSLPLLVSIWYIIHVYYVSN